MSQSNVTKQNKYYIKIKYDCDAFARRYISGIQHQEKIKHQCEFALPKFLAEGSMKDNGGQGGNVLRKGHAHLVRPPLLQLIAVLMRAEL